MLFAKIMMGCLLAANIISDQQSNVKNIHDASSSVNSGISLGNDSPREKASGQNVSVTKTFAAFDEVSINGAFDIEIQRAAGFQVTIKADRKAVEFINADVSNEKLSISMKKDYNLDGVIKIIITLPALNKVEFTGAGNIVINDVAGKKLELIAENSAGDFIITGKTDDLKLKIDGAVSIDAGKLLAQNTEIEADGAVSVKVNVQKNLTVKASGASMIRYAGEPVIKEQLSGASSLEAIK
ncbi:MAG: head GIN domain-containing protein [Victivallaceae bacterium]